MKKFSFEQNFIKLLLPFKKKLGLVFFLLIISSLLNLVPPLLLQYAIDEFILLGNMGGLAIIIVATVAFGAIVGLEGYIRRKITQSIGHQIVKNLRDDIFLRVNQFSFEFFDQSETGELVSKILSDTERIRQFLSNGIVNFLLNILMLFGILVVMFVWNTYFGLIFLGMFPFLYIFMRFFYRKVLPITHKARKINGILTASIHESFNGIQETKLFGVEDYMLNTFNQWNEEYFDAVIEGNKYSSLWNPAIPLILNIASVLFIAIGGITIIKSPTTMSTGLFIAAIAYFGLLSQPIRGISRFVHHYTHAKASGERVFGLLDRVPLIQDSENAEELADVKGSIRFEEVNFGYNSGPQVLTDIDFQVHPGETIALVGPSGVGKSTIAHLIPRFYDVVSGQIFVEDTDIRDITLDSLRQNIGIVFQNVFLFDGTIGENIAYGKEDASFEKIREAAKIAQLDDFIMSSPDFYETLIGERGVKLSGGQAQRLSLARVLVTDPKILIMDEPTSNVDAVTDKNLMEAVKAVMKNRTTIVIAHRLWTVKNADRIILLKDGKIEAIGSHKELISKSEFYNTFFDSQFHNTLGREE